MPIVPGPISLVATHFAGTLPPRLLADINACDSEPVNTTGAIQPFGALAVLSEERFVNWSSNLCEMLGIPHSSRIDLSGIFNDDARARLAAALAAAGDGPLPPLSLMTRSGRKFNVMPHRHCDRTLLEFEPVKYDVEERSHQLEYELAALVSILDGVPTLSGVCDEAVRALRRMSGYDRVMIYKFHGDMHGEVVAEEKSAELESWLGLHYPASDIPLPAREIFLLNKLRVIPAVDYAPVPIVGSDHATLDLGRSLLRSASPIHIEYLKNMRVSASLTVSIKIRGALWGLIACHHYHGPRLPVFAQRQMYAMAGDYVSAAIARRTEDELNAERERVRAAEHLLRVRMETLPELADALAGGDVTALDLMPASAGGLAIRYADRWITKGMTPNIPQLEALGQSLGSRIADEPYATDCLSSVHEPSRFYAGRASGLLAISVPGAANAIVLWFKPEALQTITWSGDPAKPSAPPGARLHPRKSFAAWSETVQFTSSPWNRWEIAAAAALQAAITTARLQYQYERERLARAEAERAKRTREEFMTVISHDLRNPLHSVTLNVALLLKMSEQVAATPTMKAIIASMQRATKQMQWLIDGLLDIAQAESGTLDLSVQRVSANGLITNAVDVISPVAESAGVVLEIQLPASEIFVKCDEQRIMQVLSNLIGNAVKFTPEKGRVKLSIECSAVKVTFHIIDNGPGIPEAHLAHIFDRFWRGGKTHVQGVGLGLSIVKAIIAAHEGEITVSNRAEGGACFAFTLDKS